VRTAILLLVVLSAPLATVAETLRCGTDDFGNTVCMDGNGVMTIAPAASAVSPAGSARDDRRVRCGIDPFGNKVCR